MLSTVCRATEEAQREALEAERRAAEAGDPRAIFVGNYFPEIPVLLRVHSVAWHSDLEADAISSPGGGRSIQNFLCLGLRVGAVWNP